MFLIDNINDKQDTARRETAFLLFLITPALVLAPGVGGDRTLARDVNRRCRLFLNGHLSQLIDEYDRGQTTARARREQRAGSETASTTRKRAARISRLVSAGQFGKARRELLSPGVATSTPEVVQQLRDKHPARQQPIDWNHIQSNPRTQVEISWELLEKVLRTSPKLSGPGLTGLRQDHFRALLFSKLSQSDKSALSTFFTDIANARVPPAAIDPLLSSTLIPILKVAGKEDVRPITLPESLLKIPARCIGRSFRRKLNTLFTSVHQLGEGVSGGLEAAVHSLQILLSQNHEFLALSIDMKNAFNSIRRADVAKQVYRHFPELVPFFKMCYQPASKLYLRLVDGTFEILTSDEGTRQGEPLAGTFFNLGFLVILEQLQLMFPKVTPLAIHDDVTLIGPPEDVISAFEWILQAVPWHTGLEIQATKSKAYCPAGRPDDSLLGDSIKWLPMNGEQLSPGKAYIKYGDGLVLAGIPIGTPEFIQANLQESIGSSQELANAIRDIKEGGFVQQAFLLDYYCLAPKINHLLRGLPPSATANAARDHDQILVRANAETLGLDPTEIDPNLRRQFFRPQSQTAGLGFTSSEAVAPAAYVASLALTASTMATIPAVAQQFDSLEFQTSSWHQGFLGARQTLETTAPDLDIPFFPELVEAPVPQFQRKISQSISEYQTAEFLESLSPYESARVTSAGSVGASAWLTSFGRGNQTISSEQFRIALLWRLGLPQPILKGVHRCCKPGHPPVDPEGVHFVNRNCGSANSARHTAMNESSSGEWRTVRHDAIARVIRDCVHEAGFRTKWQPGNLPNLPNRFGDIEVYDFPHPGRSTILDNTCVCPYKGDRTLSQPPDGAPILAARVAESKKEETYSQMHRDQNPSFHWRMTFLGEQPRKLKIS